MSTENSGVWDKTGDLLDQNRQVVPWLEVKKEHILNSLDASGNLVLRTDGWYWLKVDPTDPNKTEWFATYVEVRDKEGKIIKVPGGPDSSRKINSAKLWIDEKNPSKSQLIFNEEDANLEKGTVGEISPLVLKTSEGSFVAVQDANRFGLVYIEAFRRGFTRPENEAPQVKKSNDKIRITRYTDEQLGLHHSNNARILAPNGHKAYISDGLTVLETQDSGKPPVTDGRWIPVEEFMTHTEEGMGKTIIGTAAYLGYIDKADPVKLKDYLETMPEHVRRAKDELKRK